MQIFVKTLGATLTLDVVPETTVDQVGMLLRCSQRIHTNQLTVHRLLPHAPIRTLSMVHLI